MATVLPRIRSLTGHALDFLFPRWCIGCGREGDVVCRSCRQTFSFIGPLYCSRCGRPLDDDGFCRNCDGVEMSIDGIRAPFLFIGLVRQVIHELKYRNLKAAAPFLAHELALYLEEYPVIAHMIVPVPLHKKRLKERGYNQSQLIGGHLAELTGVPLVTDCLIRRKHTPSLARSANREVRKENIEGAFDVSGRDIEGKDIMLVDDVSTTGTTLDACAVVLKKAGARQVWGLVIALEL